jgi:hypothetical protein
MVFDPTGGTLPLREIKFTADGKCATTARMDAMTQLISLQRLQNKDALRKPSIIVRKINNQREVQENATHMVEIFWRFLKIPMQSVQIERYRRG